MAHLKIADCGVVAVAKECGIADQRFHAGVIRKDDVVVRVHLQRVENVRACKVNIVVVTQANRCGQADSAGDRGRRRVHVAYVNLVNVLAADDEGARIDLLKLGLGQMRAADEVAKAHGAVREAREFHSRSAGIDRARDVVIIRDDDGNVIDCARRVDRAARAENITHDETVGGGKEVTAIGVDIATDRNDLLSGQGAESLTNQFKIEPSGTCRFDICGNQNIVVGLQAQSHICGAVDVNLVENNDVSGVVVGRTARDGAVNAGDDGGVGACAQRGSQSRRTDIREVGIDDVRNQDAERVDQPLAGRHEGFCAHADFSTRGFNETTRSGNFTVELHLAVGNGDDFAAVIGFNLRVFCDIDIAAGQDDLAALLRYGGYVDDAFHVNDIVDNALGHRSRHNDFAAFGIDLARRFKQGIAQLAFDSNFNQTVAVHIERNGFTGRHNHFAHLGIDDAAVDDCRRHESRQTGIGNRYRAAQFDFAVAEILEAHRVVAIHDVGIRHFARRRRDTGNIYV